VSDLKKTSTPIAVSVLLILVIVILPFAWARSPNECSSCHASTRQQYLDVLESNAANIIPSSIGVGETKTVSIVVQNTCNTAKFSTLSGVQLILTSQSGRFKVTTPTYNIATMPIGTKIATWQVTGVTEGSDSLIVTANAVNNHNNVKFNDAFSPSPSIKITTTGIPVTIIVTDSTTNEKLAGVTVTLGTGQQITDANGIVTFTVTSNTYKLNLKKTGYTPTDETITITSSITLNRSFTPVSTTTYPVTLVMLDSSNQAKLEGVTVTIGASSQVTDANGIATLRVASGTYSLILSKTGYTPLNENITVTSATSLNRGMTPTSQPTYILTITLINSATSEKVPDATVTLNTEQQKTNPNGVASFIVKEGQYTLEITKNGYNPVSENVIVTGNANLNKDLTPIQTPKTYAIVITVVEKITTARIAKANVTIDGTLKLTDSNGLAFFLLEPGSHQLDIAKDEYMGVSEVIQVSEDSSVIWEVSKLPPPPAEDLNPLMIFIHPPIAVSSYLVVFAFTAYLFLREDRTKSLSRLGFASWGLTLLTLVTGMIWAQSAWGNYWSWEPKENTSLVLFILISAALVAFTEGRRNLARGLGLLSCVPILFSLPGIFALVGFELLLLVIVIRSDRIEADDRKQGNRIRAIAIKLNRFISWIFLTFTIIAFLSGYTMTRLRINPGLDMVIHTDLGYIFSAILISHVFLSLLGGYPWKQILKNFFDKRNVWTLAMMLQAVSAILLTVLSGIQVLTGLGYINSSIATLIPLLLHIRLDSLLLYTFIVHGIVGLRAFLMRNKLKLPGKDIIYLLIGILLFSLIAIINP
jgi:hypothetical protein